MRTKILLSAAAALAVGLVASNAQTPVYSANVVGYVNVACPQTNYIFVANPLTTGNDVISNVVKSVPGASQALVWNGSSFSLYTYSALAHSWKQGTVNADNTPLPPGLGFFLYCSQPFTNTFVGSVVANSGTSVTNALSTGFSAVGSLIPYADTVTNSATINLQVPGATQLLKWDVASQSYTLYTYSALAQSWKVGTVSTNPVVNVGEGFFINPPSSVNWVESLQ